MSRTTSFDVIAVLGSAAFGGVMIAIGLGLGSYWWSLDHDVFLAWFGANFIFLLPTVLVTLGPALVATGSTMRRSSPRVREHWTRAFRALVGTVAITCVAHLPLNIVFWTMELTAAQVSGLLVLWLALHALRIALAFVAARSGLRALLAG